MMHRWGRNWHGVVVEREELTERLDSFDSFTGNQIRLVDL